jgi:hypothetical protein
MSEVERFQESDRLSEVVHPFLSKSEGFKFVYLCDHAGLRVAGMIVLDSEAEGTI